MNKTVIRVFLIIALLAVLTVVFVSIASSSEGLLVHWKLDDGQGTTATDVSGYGNHGTLTNGPMWSTDVPLTTFDNPYSLEFDGADDYVDGGADINIADSSFTIAFWAKRFSAGTFDIAISQGTASLNKGLHIGFRDNDVFTCGFYANDLHTPQFPELDWHHWACTFDADTKMRTIFRDGQLIGGIRSNSTYLGAGNLLIGQ